ncbi:hypothetical protein CIW48_24505 [Methylobacterium sp. P1-11]|uniref:hypothetical protein n=1 Tax=Methylobacterium sp. P1-11 TaxID=2024616 RepID=UPI0011EEE0CF|nr:hypothetical protein [Methylobacterium sp. P1-11]KAA0121235.1 hypothetical protein CIW48_24505 [Methylobacterium sp. P1-11]
MQKAAPLDRTDRDGNDVPEARTQRIRAKIAALRRQMAFLRELQEPVEAADDGQVSLTGPDARSMATSGRGIGIVGYNVEIAVDPEHHLVVAHDVVNEGHDRTQLVPVGGRGRQAFDAGEVVVLADRTLKAWIGTTPFLTRGHKGVRTEMSLAILADNVKRMICLFGATWLIPAIRA